MLLLFRYRKYYGDRKKVAYMILCYFLRAFYWYQFFFLPSLEKSAPHNQKYFFPVLGRYGHLKILELQPITSKLLQIHPYGLYVNMYLVHILCLCTAGFSSWFKSIPKMIMEKTFFFKDMFFFSFFDNFFAFISQ